MLQTTQNTQYRMVLNKIKDEERLSKIVQSKDLLGITWEEISEIIPISANGIRQAFERRSVNSSYVELIEDFLSIRTPPPVKKEVITQPHKMKGNELKELRQRHGLTQQELADELKMTRRSIAKLESMDEMPESRVAHLKLYFNHRNNAIEVNQPLTYIQTKNGINYQELPNGKFMIQVPIIPIKAQATYISEYTDPEYINQLTKTTFMVDRIGHGNYRAFEIVNDSMNDGSINSIPHGSIVLARELQKTHWKDKLRYNVFPYWIIVHKDTILCKQITYHDVNNGHITCHSLNDSPEYSDFTVNLDEVHQIFNVIKVQRDV